MSGTIWDEACAIERDGNKRRAIERDGNKSEPGEKKSAIKRFWIKGVKSRETVINIRHKANPRYRYVIELTWMSKSVKWYDRHTIDRDEIKDAPKSETWSNTRNKQRLDERRAIKRDITKELSKSNTGWNANKRARREERRSVSLDEKERNAP